MFLFFNDSNGVCLKNRKNDPDGCFEKVTLVMGLLRIILIPVVSNENCSHSREITSRSTFKRYTFISKSRYQYRTVITD